jgi:hypothetical protein
LTSLDISDNSLFAEGTKLLAEALKSNQIMTALNISSNNMTYDGDKDIGDMSGVAALADTMPGMGAMTTLNISNNNIGKPDEFPEGWSYGLKEGCHSIYEYKHTDGRKQDDPPAGSKSSGLTALADAIKNMGALSTFTFSGDYSSSSWPVAMETTMTEADFSCKNLGVSGSMMVAAFLPKCQ